MKKVIVATLMIVAIMFSGCGESDEADLKSGPFLTAKVDVSLVKELMANKKKSSEQTDLAFVMLKTIGIESVNLVVDNMNDSLEFLVYSDILPNKFAEVATNPLLKPHLKKISENCFEIITPEDQNMGYKLNLAKIEDKIVVGSSTLVNESIKNKLLPATYSISKYQGKKPGSLSITAVCSEDIDEQFAKIITPLLTKSTKDLKVSPMVVYIIKSMAKRIFEPIKGVEAFSISADISETLGTRSLVWEQWQRNPETLERSYKLTKKPGYKLYADESTLGTILRKKELSPQINLEDNKLSISINWDKKEDSEISSVLKKVLQKIVSNLGTESSKSLSTNPPLTKVIPFSKIVPNYNISQVKESLPEKVKASLIYDGYSTGWRDNPGREKFVSNAINIPNYQLCDIDLKAKSLFSGDKNILAKSKGSYFGSVSFPALEKGADRGVLTINAKLPINIKEVTLSNDEVGKEKVVGTTKVLLKELTDTVATVAVSNIELSKKLYAFDKRGNCLDGSPKRTGAILSHSFSGKIDSLKLYIFETEEFSSEIELEIPEKEVRLSELPKDKIPTYYSKTGVSLYNNPDLSKLENLKVTYNEKKKQLELNIDKKGLSISDDWNCKYFGKDKEIATPRDWGSFTMHDGSIEYVKKSIDKVNDCHVVSGTVKVEIATGLKIHKVQADKPFTYKKDGKGYRVSLQDNQVIFTSFGPNAAPKNYKQQSVMAYDINGMMLKKSSFSSFSSSSKGEQSTPSSFWGIPESALVQVQTQKIVKELDFKIIIDENYDKKAYASYEALLKHDQAMKKVLEEIVQELKKYPYDVRHINTLAGLYYVEHNRSPKTFSKEIANSDKTGAEIFGYQCKPYQGYYFSYPTKVNRNGKEESLTSDETQKFKFRRNGKELTKEFLKSDNDGDIIAVPADQKQPIYYIDWMKKVYRYTGEKAVTIGPDRFQHDKKDWIQIK